MGREGPEQKELQCDTKLVQAPQKVSVVLKAHRAAAHLCVPIGVLLTALVFPCGHPDVSPPLEKLTQTSTEESSGSACDRYGHPSLSH